MKRLKLIKIIANSLVVASVLALNPTGASAEWKQDSTGWWNMEGSSWSVGWKEINGRWYYFGQDGYMVHDKTIDSCNIGSDGTWIQSNTQTEKNHTSNSFDVNVSIKYNIQLDDKVKDVNPNIIKATRQAMFDVDCYFARLQHYNDYTINNDVLIFYVKDKGTDTWEVDFYEKKSEDKEYNTIGYCAADVTKQKDGTYIGGMTHSTTITTTPETY